MNNVAEPNKNGSNWACLGPYWVPRAESYQEKVKTYISFIFLLWEDAEGFWDPFALILKDQNHIFSKT